MPQPGQPDTRAPSQPPTAPGVAPGGPAGGLPGAPAGELPGAPAHTRAQARAQAAARESAAGLTAGPTAGLTRPPAPGELAYEATITAPTEWVPYVYTTAEIQTHAARRGLSVAAAIFGVLGLLTGIFMIWGVPLSVAAVALALVARFVEHRSGALWIAGLVTGVLGILVGVLWFVVNTELLPAFYG